MTELPEVDPGPAPGRAMRREYINLEMRVDLLTVRRKPRLRTVAGAALLKMVAEQLRAATVAESVLHKDVWPSGLVSYSLGAWLRSNRFYVCLRLTSGCADLTTLWTSVREPYDGAISAVLAQRLEDEAEDIVNGSIDSIKDYRLFADEWRPCLYAAVGYVAFHYGRRARMPQHCNRYTGPHGPHGDFWTKPSC